MALGEHRKQWYQYLPIAILNDNTTYRSSTDWEPCRVSESRVPHNSLDPKIARTTDFAVELIRRTKILNEKLKKKFMQAYIN